MEALSLAGGVACVPTGAEWGPLMAKHGEESGREQQN